MKHYILHLFMLVVVLFYSNFIWGQRVLGDLPNPDELNEDLETGKYILQKDWKPGNQRRWRVNSNRNVIIDLNGHTIDGTNIGRTILNIARGKLTIIDSSPNQTGKIINSQKSCFYVAPEASKNYYATLIIEGGTIQDCRPSDGNGGAMEITKRGTAIMRGGIIKDCRGAQGAAVYCNGGTFTMEGGIIKDNMVHSIMESNDWTKPTEGKLPVGISSTKWYDNDSYAEKERVGKDSQGNHDYKGGAVYVESGKFEMSGGEISGNASINGGAIYITNGTTFTLTGGTIKNNYATSSGSTYGNGGGIYLNNATCTIKKGEKDLVFEGNAATRSGGGIFVDNSTLNIIGVELYDNIASNGGGLACEGNSTTTMTLTNCDVNKNSAKTSKITNSGTGGGVYLANVNGTLKLNNSNILYNSAETSGGGICVQNGKANLDGTSRLSNNNAKEYGGGLYIVNTSEASKTIIFEGGGTIDGNTAKSGGAVCANGKMTLTFAATMENNTATDGVGGGLCMFDGVTMNFGDGLIRSNKAEGTLILNGGTAYQKDANTVNGVGGGIFMGKNTALTFTSNEMGIYNNSATNAGADICANGQSTSITLPNITNMNLKGFDVVGNDLYWVEDYFINDIYAKTKPGIRYETALKTPNIEIENYIVNDSKKTEYLCLDLGYDLVFVTLNTLGLDSNHDAAITMAYPKKDGNGNVIGNEIYRRVLFTGEQSKVVGLPSGDWKFAASPWSFKYNDPSFNPSHNNDGYIKISRDDTKDVQITFTVDGNKKNIREYQHRVVNRMKP